MNGLRLGRGRLPAVAFLTTLAMAPAATASAASLWHMDELSGSSARDAMGSANGNMKNIQLGQPGVSGTGFGFTGNSAVLLKSDSLNPGSSNFSYTVHVAFTQNPSSSVGDYDLMRKGLSSSKGGDYKMEILGGGKSSCYFKGSSGKGTVNGPSGLNDGRWHTITCGRSGGTIFITVDGSTKTSSKQIGSISNSATASIGAKAGGGDEYTGLMDEVSWSLG
jgi:concanavalin A-like lectin/glucanase superfamily protein